TRSPTWSWPPTWPGPRPTRRPRPSRLGTTAFSLWLWSPRLRSASARCVSPAPPSRCAAARPGPTGCRSTCGSAGPRPTPCSSARRPTTGASSPTTCSSPSGPATPSCPTPWSADVGPGARAGGGPDAPRGRSAEAPAEQAARDPLPLGGQAAGRRLLGQRRGPLARPGPARPALRPLQPHVEAVGAERLQAGVVDPLPGPGGGQRQHRQLGVRAAGVLLGQRPVRQGAHGVGLDPQPGQGVTEHAVVGQAPDLADLGQRLDGTLDGQQAGDPPQGAEAGPDAADDRPAAVEAA